METRGTQTIRHRARLSAAPAGTSVNAPIQAEQIEVPGTGITLSRQQLAIVGAVLLAILLVAGARGGGRNGLVISRA